MSEKSYPFTIGGVAWKRLFGILWRLGMGIKTLVQKDPTELDFTDGADAIVSAFGLGGLPEWSRTSKNFHLLRVYYAQTVLGTLAEKEMAINHIIELLAKEGVDKIPIAYQIGKKYVPNVQKLYNYLKNLAIKEGVPQKEAEKMAQDSSEEIKDVIKQTMNEIISQQMEHINVTPHPIEDFPLTQMERKRFKYGEEPDISTLTSYPEETSSRVRKIADVTRPRSIPEEMLQIREPEPYVFGSSRATTIPEQMLNLREPEEVKQVVREARKDISSGRFKTVSQVFNRVLTWGSRIATAYSVYLFAKELQESDGRRREVIEQKVKQIVSSLITQIIFELLVKGLEAFGFTKTAAVLKFIAISMAAVSTGLTLYDMGKNIAEFIKPSEEKRDIPVTEEEKILLKRMDGILNERGPLTEGHLINYLGMLNRLILIRNFYKTKERKRLHPEQDLDWSTDDENKNFLMQQVIKLLESEPFIRMQQNISASQTDEKISEFQEKMKQVKQAIDKKDEVDKLLLQTEALGLLQESSNAEKNKLQKQIEKLIPEGMEVNLADKKYLETVERAADKRLNRQIQEIFRYDDFNRDLRKLNSFEDAAELLESSFKKLYKKEEEKELKSGDPETDKLIETVRKAPEKIPILADDTRESSQAARKKWLHKIETDVKSTLPQNRPRLEDIPQIAQVYMGSRKQDGPLEYEYDYSGIQPLYANVSESLRKKNPERYKLNVELNKRIKELEHQTDEDILRADAERGEDEQKLVGKQIADTIDKLKTLQGDVAELERTISRIHVDRRLRAYFKALRENSTRLLPAKPDDDATEDELELYKENLKLYEKEIKKREKKIEKGLKKYPLMKPLVDEYKEVKKTFITKLKELKRLVIENFFPHPPFPKDFDPVKPGHVDNLNPSLRDVYEHIMWDEYLRFAFNFPEYEELARHHRAELLKEANERAIKEYGMQFGDIGISDPETREVIKQMRSKMSELDRLRSQIPMDEDEVADSKQLPMETDEDKKDETGKKSAFRSLMQVASDVNTMRQTIETTRVGKQILDAAQLLSKTKNALGLGKIQNKRKKRNANKKKSKKEIKKSFELWKI